LDESATLLDIPALVATESGADADEDEEDAETEGDMGGDEDDGTEVVESTEVEVVETEGAVVAVD
jgi:hypothetical protein